jgi:hypothetical protein
MASMQFTESAGEATLILRGVAVTPLRPLTSDDIEPRSQGRMAS